MLSSGATRLTVIGLEQRTVDGDDEKRAITPCGASLAKRSHLAPKGARKRGGRASVSGGEHLRFYRGPPPFLHNYR